MAYLLNEAKSLRWRLQFADKEILPPGPMTPAPPPGGGRLLATTAVEFFDRRDQRFWPMYRQAVLWIAIDDGRVFADHLGALVRGELPRFEFRSVLASDFGWQFERRADGRTLVELGFDLNAFLAGVSGQGGDWGRDLALFRFHTSQAHLVAFGDQIRTELNEILTVPSSGAPPAA